MNTNIRDTFKNIKIENDRILKQIKNVMEPMNPNIRDTFEDIKIENDRILKQIKNVRESMNQLMIQMIYIYKESMRINEYIKEIEKNNLK